MTYRTFEMPAFHEFFDALGTGPEAIDGGDAQQVVFFQDNEELVVTLDSPGRCVGVRWTRKGVPLLEAFREGAVGVRLTTVGGTTALTVIFETDSQRGELRVQTAPEFSVTDRLLFR